MGRLSKGPCWTDWVNSTFQGVNHTMKKEAFHNPKRADMRHIFNWGLKISEFNEIYWVTGHGCGRFPDDPVAQTRAIQQDQLKIIEEAGFSVHDIVRTEWTFDKSVTDEQAAQITALWADFLRDVNPKPAAGTLRYVDRLAHPAMKVEFELLVAR